MYIEGLNVHCGLETINELVPIQLDALCRGKITLLFGIKMLKIILLLSKYQTRGRFIKNSCMIQIFSGPYKEEAGVRQ